MVAAAYSIRAHWCGMKDRRNYRNFRITINCVRRRLRPVDCLMGASPGGLLDLLMLQGNYTQTWLENNLYSHVRLGGFACNSRPLVRASGTSRCHVTQALTADQRWLSTIRHPNLQALRSAFSSSMWLPLPRFQDCETVEQCADLVHEWKDCFYARFRNDLSNRAGNQQYRHHWQQVVRAFDQRLHGLMTLAQQSSYNEFRGQREQDIKQLQHLRDVSYLCESLVTDFWDVGKHGKLVPVFTLTCPN